MFVFCLLFVPVLPEPSLPADGRRHAVAHSQSADSPVCCASPGLIRVDKLSCIIGNDLSTHVSKKRDILSQVDLQGPLTGNLGSTAPYVSRHLGPIAATTAPWPATKETNKQEGSSLGLTWANMTLMFGVAVEGPAVSRCSVSDSASDSASTTQGTFGWAG